MIKTIILDLDGPILDGRYRHYACYSRILTEHGYTPISLETYWSMKRERKDRKQQLAVSGAEKIYDEFLMDWLELIEQPEMLMLDQLQPGVTAKLQQWQETGLRLFLATMRRYPERLYEQLRQLGLNIYFKHVVVCDYRVGGAGKAQNVKDAAPDLVPEDTLWIGDAEADIEAARILGMHVLAITSGLRTEEFLSSLRPDFIYKDMAEVELGKLLCTYHRGVMPSQ